MISILHVMTTDCSIVGLELSSVYIVYIYYINAVLILVGLNAFCTH